MSVPLSIDLRQRIIDAWLKEGLSLDELAQRYAVGIATVNRLKRRYRETGDVLPKPHAGGARRKIPKEKECLVRELVEKHPDWTEEEYAAALAKERGIVASSVTVGRVIRSLGYSVKKRPSALKKEIVQMSSNGELSTSTECEPSPLRVWFSWTKPARTRQ